MLEVTPIPRLPRVPFHCPVYIAVPSISTAPARLSAENLSKGGMFIRCVEPPAEGTTVTVALEVDDAPMVFAEARVVWARPHGGFGVAFTQLNRTGVALVDSLIRHGGTSSLGAVQHGKTPLEGYPRGKAPELPPEPKTEPEVVEVTHYPVEPPTAPGLKGPKRS